VIKLLNEAGSLQTIKQRGRLNITSHPSALDTLEHKALCFINKAKSQDALDNELINAILAQAEEGDNAYSTLDVNNNELNQIQQLIEENRELLEPIGDGILRLASHNTNSLPATLSNNEHLEDLRTVADDLELDALALSEHRNNLMHRNNRRYSLSQLFQGGDAMVRGIWASNKQENIDQFISKRTMEGGTGLVAFGELASCMNSANSGIDPLGLGRMVWMEFRGRDGHSTVMLSGYVPCRNNREDSGTSYQQQRRYFINKEKEVAEPRARLLKDMTEMLTKWREEGKRLVVCLDANEDVYKDIFGCTLTDREGLDMVEAVLENTGTKMGATHFRGSRPIDAVWVTRDLEVVNACAMPIGFGPRDHRMIVVDVTARSMVGSEPQAIVRPGARCLNSKCPTSLRNYNKCLEELISKHRLTERLLEAHKCKETMT
jgi:hypothetical protein